MQSVSHTPVIICFMVMTYFMLVGAISWVAWKRRDDGIRGLALGLCTFTLAYILVMLRGVLPKDLMISAYYCLMGQAYIFLLYGIRKNLQLRMNWTVGEIPLLLLIISNACLYTDYTRQAAANFAIYIAQFSVIAGTIFLKKRKTLSCGSNMMLAGMFVAIVIDLWWIWNLFSVNNFILTSSHPENYQTQLDFLTYVLCLLVTNGFILMSKEQVEAKLEQNRQTDELTGLHSSHLLERGARRALDRLQELAIPVTLLLIDIDHFRTINSQYGNACGDAVLRELSRILRDFGSPASEIYRMRCGNFAVLIYGRNIYQITERCEALLSLVSTHDFPHNNRVTISCGISVGMGTDSWAQWFDRAIKALKMAKARGRNRVHVFGMDFIAGNFPTGINRVGELHWLPGYSTGNRQLDEQHQILFRRTNVMLQLWASTSDKATIANTAKNFISLAAAHFTFEINLLKAELPGSTEAHNASHEKLLARANAMLARYQRNDLTNDALFSFLVFEFVMPHTWAEVAAFSEQTKSAPVQTALAKTDV